MTSYQVHGVGVDICGAHPAVEAQLASRLASFSVAEPGAPAPIGQSRVRFEYLDAEADGVRPVRAPPGTGRSVYDAPGGPLVYYDLVDELYFDYLGRVRVHCDPAKGLVRTYARDPGGEDLRLLAHPLFTIPFLELLKRRRRYPVHAAATAVEGQAVLFAGPSGSGKSTLAVAMVRAGLSFLGDDTVFISSGEQGALQVLGFPDEIDFTLETEAMFTELARVGWPSSGHNAFKRSVRVETAFGVAPLLVAAPRVLVFPQVSASARSVASRLDGADALQMLLPNLLLTEPESCQNHLDALARLVRSCRCWRLATGRDLQRLPEMVTGMLDDAGTT